MPDGDTGTNFWLTMKSIADALTRLGDAPLPDVSRTAAQAAVMGSRGNSGMMLSHFLVGFDQAVGPRFRLRAPDVAIAIRRGFDTLEAALENPVEGTILTVCREAARGAEASANRNENVAGVLRAALKSAEVALERTPDLLQDLKKAGVVDAGGKGFVRMMEGVVRLLDGQATEEAEEDRRAIAAVSNAAAAFTVEDDRDYRFCTEVLVRGAALPSSGAARGQLHALDGGSLLVLRTADLLRVHVHLDDPEPLFAMASAWGDVVTRKAEDMREQHQLLAAVARRDINIVTDSSCDLPDDILDRHGIGLVPLQLTLGDTAYEDRVNIQPAAIYQYLRQQREPHPTTSQPAPGAFVTAFEHAHAEAHHVVAVLLSSALSGTFGNAEAARRQYQGGGVTLVDSRTASLGLGMLALRAAELAEAGIGAADIAAELLRIRGESGCFFTVATLDNLMRSGRVSRVKGWLGNLLDMKPILTIDHEGRVMPVDRVRGRGRLLPRVLDLLDECIPRGRARLRMGVVHADTPGTADEIRKALQERYNPFEIIVNPVTAVIGIHTGPDAWGVFYQVEDGERNATRAGAV